MKSAERSIPDFAASSVLSRALTATPDGKQALGVGPDNMPRVWNLETGDELQKIAAPPRIACAAYSPDGRAVALGADDGAVWLVPIEAEA